MAHSSVSHVTDLHARESKIQSRSPGLDAPPPLSNPLLILPCPLRIRLVLVLAPPLRPFFFLLKFFCLSSMSMRPTRLLMPSDLPTLPSFSASPPIPGNILPGPIPFSTSALSFSARAHKDSNCVVQTQTDRADKPMLCKRCKCSGRVNSSSSSGAGGSRQKVQGQGPKNTSGVFFSVALF